MPTTDRQNAYSGTRDVAERLRFDVARLETYLREHAAGFAGPLEVSQFKGCLLYTSNANTSSAAGNARAADRSSLRRAS